MAGNILGGMAAGLIRIRVTVRIKNSGCKVEFAERTKKQYLGTEK
jgi:hypothetical protein